MVLTHPFTSSNIFATSKGSSFVSMHMFRPGIACKTLVRISRDRTSKSRWLLGHSIGGNNLGCSFPGFVTKVMFYVPMG